MSVIIPVFNGAITIKRAIDSVLAQTYSNLEIIIVNDGSWDSTAEVIAHYNNPKITTIDMSKNRGAAAARNRAIEAATGEWIAFLDADDAWKPDKIKRQIELLEQSSESALACGTGYEIEKNGRRLSVILDLSPQRFREDIIFGCTISPGSTLVVERSVFVEIGGFDEDLRRLEDWDWLLRYTENYEIIFVPEPLTEVFLSWEKPFGLDPTSFILKSVRLLRAKHSPNIRSLRRRLKFKGALLIETAAAYHRASRPVLAGLFVVMGLAHYPIRNSAFFRTLWRAARDRLPG